MRAARAWKAIDDALMIGPSSLHKSFWPTQKLGVGIVNGTSAVAANCRAFAKKHYTHPLLTLKAS